LEVLIEMLRVAYEKNKLFRLPVIYKLKINNIRKGFFERDLADRVLNFLPSDYQVAVKIDETYGWRTQSEVLTMEWSYVDFGVGTLRLDPGITKNDDRRVVYMTQEIKILMTEQLARVRKLQQSMGRVIPYVFPHLSDRHRGERIQDFKKAWKTACKKAGCPGIRRHDFRRTAVRNNERAGKPRSIGMKMTGHGAESVYHRLETHRSLIEGSHHA
jgi:integrase